MTNDTALWMALNEHLPRKKWIAIADIYIIVQHRVLLDAEDLENVNTRSANPRWKSNVRRVLHSKQEEGTLLRRKSLSEDR
jgi:hypothetical protein